VPPPLADLGSNRTNITAGGTYTGTAGRNYVLTQNLSGATINLGGTGTASNRIVVRSDTGERVLTNCTINLNGAYCNLAGVVMNGGKVNFNGANQCAVHCEFTNKDGARLSQWFDFGNSQSKSSVHYNDFTTRLGPLKCSIMGMEMDSNGVVFKRNYIRGVTSDEDHPAYTFVFYPGDSNTTSNSRYGLQILENFFLDCAGVRDLVEIKSSGMDFIGNTIQNCGDAGIRLRHGEDHRVNQNLWINCSTGVLITVRTGPHSILDNQCKNADGSEREGKITIYAGNMYWDYERWIKQHDPGGGNNHQSAGHCKVGGNHATIVVGDQSNDNSGNIPPEDNIIARDPAGRADRNRAINLLKHNGTDWTGATGGNYSRELTRLSASNTGRRMGV
jgi:hypothetical protein